MIWCGILNQYNSMGTLRHDTCCVTLVATLILNYWRVIATMSIQLLMPLNSFFVSSPHDIASSPSVSFHFEFDFNFLDFLSPCLLLFAVCCGWKFTVESSSSKHSIRSGRNQTSEPERTYSTTYILNVLLPLNLTLN